MREMINVHRILTGKSTIAKLDFPRCFALRDDSVVNVPEESRLQRSDACCGVCVSIAGQDFPKDVILDELQRPSRCSVVAIHD